MAKLGSATEADIANALADSERTKQAHQAFREDSRRGKGVGGGSRSKGCKKKALGLGRPRKYVYDDQRVNGNIPLTIAEDNDVHDDARLFGVAVFELNRTYWLLGRADEEAAVKRPSDAARPKNANLPLSEAEDRDVHQRAKIHGISISEYNRRLWLHGRALRKHDREATRSRLTAAA